MSWEAVLKVKRKRRIGTSVRGRKVSKPKPFKPTKPTKPKSAIPKPLTTPERFQPDNAKEPKYEGGSTYPYGKSMIPGDDRMDMNPTLKDLERLLEEGKELPSWAVVTDNEGIKGIDVDKTLENYDKLLASRTHRTMDRPNTIDIPPNERDKHLTMDDPSEEREEEDEEEEPQTRASYRYLPDQRFNPFTVKPKWQRKLERGRAKKFRRR